MPRIGLIIFISFVLCFVLIGQENDFMESQQRQKHNFHLVAPKGAYVKIELFIDDLVIKNEGTVPYDPEIKEFYKYYYEDHGEDFNSIGYLKNAVTFPELEHESKLKLLQIKVTVTLAHKEEDYTHNFTEYVNIEHVYDSDIYVCNSGKIDIKVAFG